MNKIKFLLLMIFFIFITTNIAYAQATPTPTVKSNILNQTSPTPTLVKTENANAQQKDNDYIDLKDHWAKGYMENLANTGILSGYPDKTIKPNLNINRAEIAKILVTAKEIPLSESKTIAFADKNKIPPWALKYIDTAVKNDIIKGFSDNTFRSSKQITRKEMAVMMIRMMGYDNVEKIAYDTDTRDSTIKDNNVDNTDNPPLLTTSFSDDDKIPSWAKPSVLIANELGLIKGYSANTFKPDNLITRAEASAMLVRALDILNTTNSAEEIVETDKNKRYENIFGPGKTSYSSFEEAKSNMTFVEINVWKFNSKTGEKYSSKTKVEVNKKIANIVKSIFTEIYNDPEKFPIKTIGGFRWPDSHINHPSGTGIDINWEENYYLDSKGTKVGSFWLPGENAYSMPADGSVVRIFKKYGWDWGGDWRSLKDYMHFSYLGG